MRREGLCDERFRGQKLVMVPCDDTQSSRVNFHAAPVPFRGDEAREGWRPAAREGASMTIVDDVPGRRLEDARLTETRRRAPGRKSTQFRWFGVTSRMLHRIVKFRTVVLRYGLLFE